jgi:hypothetical protein
MELGDAIGLGITAGVGLAVIDRIHPSGRVRYRTVYKTKRRKKKRR